MQPEPTSGSAETPLAAIARALHAAQRVLITMHRSPDGDALGSSLGLGLTLLRAGKQVVVYSADGVPTGLRFLPGAERVVSTVAADSRFDATVTCDAGHPSRLGPDLPDATRRGVFINLDHHATTPPFGDLNLLDTSAAAVGVLIHRLAVRMGLPVPADAAAALFVSLLTDTGSFRYSNTDPQVLRVAADLVEWGAKPAVLASAIWEANTPERLTLLACVLPTLQLRLGGRVALLTITAEAIARAGTAEETADGFVSYPRSLIGVDVAVLLREEGSGWRVSLRSRGGVDVAAIATTFGGGGHAAAAGLTFRGTRAQAEAALLPAITAALSA
jgi:phosphoesterase RecJ-like protein